MIESVGVDPSEAKAPSVFISYRWSSPAHEEWVLAFATSLRQNGVDAKLDKWHLRPGQDTLSFMESMVLDPSIKKVLLVCDAGYVERADNREGGVGTEAQIISAEVYSNTEQEKFAAIVLELDNQGNAVLPKYMSTRLYFDFSTQESEAVNFEAVIRWIFDEPYYSLPPLGRKPTLSDKAYVTGSSLFRVSGAAGSPAAPRGPVDAAEEVLQSISSEAQSFRLSLAGESNQKEQVIEAIKSFRSVSENSYLALSNIVNKQSDRSSDIVHSFFERLLEKWDWNPSNTTYTRWDNDPYRYFVHDAFVSFVAICLRERAFEFCNEVISTPLYKPEYDRTGHAVEYTEFRPYLESLENPGTGRGGAYRHAQMIHEAHEHSTVSPMMFIEADFLLYLRSIISPKYEWYPITGHYLSGSQAGLPIFVRAKSKRVYNRLSPLLFGISDIDLRSLIAASKDKILKFDYRMLDVPRLLAADELASAA